MPAGDPPLRVQLLVGSGGHCAADHEVTREGTRRREAVAAAELTDRRRVSQRIGQLHGERARIVAVQVDGELQQR